MSDPNRPQSLDVPIPMAEPEPLPGLDPARVADLPYQIAYQNEIDLTGRPYACTICKELIKKGEQINRLLCRHVFHAECLRHWLTNKINCPICRGPIGQ